MLETSMTSGTTSGNGAARRANGRRDVLECFEPATRERLGAVPIDSPAQVAEVVRRARAAQAVWRETSFAVRRRVLTHMQRHLLDHKEELCEVIVRATGKTRENALL